MKLSLKNTKNNQTGANIEKILIFQISIFENNYDSKSIKNYLT